MTTRVDGGAIASALFFQAYDTIWNRYFPRCPRRTHWYIAGLLRREEDGLFFSKIRGRMDDVFGMDEDTCAARLRELMSDGLAAIEGDRIHASTLVAGTPKLVATFDAHAVEAAISLLQRSQRVHSHSALKGISAAEGMELNEQLLALFAKHEAVLGDYIQRFLREALPKQPALRLRAQHLLMSSAYRFIFLTSWIHSHPERNASHDYILRDELNVRMFGSLGVGLSATTGYVQNLIRWGFLERMTKEHGVPRNKFAVRMTENAFDHFEDAFAETWPLVDETVQNIVTLGRAPLSPARQSLTAPTRAVVAPLRSNENVYGTSLETMAPFSTDLMPVKARA